MPRPRPRCQCHLFHIFFVWVFCFTFKWLHRKKRGNMNFETKSFEKDAVVDPVLCIWLGSVSFGQTFGCETDAVLSKKGIGFCIAKVLL